MLKRKTKIKIDDDKAKILLGCKEDGLKKGSMDYFSRGLSLVEG
jgi:hypothetical protein